MRTARGRSRAARGKRKWERGGRDCHLCTHKFSTVLCFSGGEQNFHWLDFDRCHDLHGSCDIYLIAGTLSLGV